MKYFKQVLLLLILMSSIATFAQSGDDSISAVKDVLKNTEDKVINLAKDSETAEKVLKDVAKLEKSLEETFGVVSDVDDTLSDFLTELERLQDAEKVIKIVLKLGETIPPLTEIVEILKVVSQGSELVTDVAIDIVKPVQEVVGEGDKLIHGMEEVAKAILLLKTVYQVSDKIPEWIKEIENDTATNIDYKCVKNKLTTFEKDYIAILKASNTILKDIKHPTEELNNIIKDIEGISKELKTATAPIKKFANDTKSLKKALKKFEKALNKKIAFKFHVHILGIKKTFHIHIISVKTAMKGVSHIEKILQDQLSGEIVAALKIFGMKKVAKEIKKLAEHPFKEAVDLLKPEIEKINIPGVKDFENTLKKTDDLFVKLVYNLKKSIHVGIPNFDADYYREIKSQGIKYFYNQCPK